jgi:PAS domain S-box-containing protein
MVPRRPEKKDPYRRLAEINRAITTSLNFDEVLNLIVENAAQLVGANICLLLLVDKDGKLRVRSALGIEQGLANAFVGQMEEDVIKRLRKLLGLSLDENLASVPIIAKRSLNGMLVIAREDPLEEEEEWQLSALADQAAIALWNARVYEMELGEANRERDQTIEALLASNQRVTRILSSITDLFYSLDREWRFTDVNTQTELRFGKSREELIGKSIWEMFPAAKESLLYPNFHNAMKEQQAVHFEVPSRIVPGVWFEAHAYPSAAGLSVYLRDITERKEGEVTSHLLASIVESSDDAIISKDLQGIISSWNKGAERIFGYTAEEVIGRPITILITPDREDEEPTILKRICAGLPIEHYETVRRRKDGQLIDVSITVSPLKDEFGNIVGASKIARDITERKLAEQEIAFQARLLNAVEQAVIATDLKGKILFWNAFAEGLYGWTADEAVDASIFDRVLPENSQDKAKEIFAFLQEGQSWSGELLLRRRDGSTFPALVTDSLITNDKGEPIGVVGVSIDVTELKRAEEEKAELLKREQLARAEAEKANKIKDEFLATLSHELRNPLNVVIGYSEILRRSEAPGAETFVTKAADVIRRNALAQSQLVSDLLDLSRLQTGKLAIDRQPVSLTTIINDAIETVKAEAEDKNITLDLSVDGENQSLIIEGDPVRLGQIAWNLLNNAVKFTRPSGLIRISLKRVDGLAELIVEDTGQGIPADFLPHVFEIFRQADASSARKQGGLGIGLALVKQLAERHGGWVTAESEGKGLGARFTVLLPLRTSSHDGRSAEVGNHAGALKDKAILVVDDSSETTEMLSRLLQMEGASVETARSGSEALVLANKHNFDLVISDISMPGMDGYQLLQKLRSVNQMAKVPAVALTGYGRTSDIDRASREGFAAHLTKPLDIEKLLKSVRKLTKKPSH